MKFLALLCLFGFITHDLLAQERGDVSFTFAPSVSHSRGINKLGDPDFSTGFGFNYYLKRNHGLGFNYANEVGFEGGQRFEDLDKFSITTIDLHYVFRHFISSKMTFLAESGLGLQIVYTEDKDYQWGSSEYEDVATAFILRYAVILRHLLVEWNKDIAGHKKLEAGVGFMQVFSFDDELEDENITGSRSNLLIQLVLSF